MHILRNFRLIQVNDNYMLFINEGMRIASIILPRFFIFVAYLCSFLS